MGPQSARADAPNRGKFVGAFGVGTPNRLSGVGHRRPSWVLAVAIAALSLGAVAPFGLVGWGAHSPAGTALPGPTSAAPGGPAAGSGSARILTDEGASHPSGATPAGGAVYSVGFSQSGLRNGTNWSVDLNGSVQWSDGASSIFYSEPNGSYLYSVGQINGFTVQSNGTVRVAGQDVSVMANFGQVDYELTFNETGLANGTIWAVTVDGGTRTAATYGQLFVWEPNGTYYYTIDHTSGLTPNPSDHGAVTVSGANVVVNVTFESGYYVSFFDGNSIPLGTNWSIDLNGTALSTRTSIINFTEPSGSYSFSVGSVAGYVSVTAGRVIVSGAAAYVLIQFGSRAYHIVFNESGLSHGTVWNLTIGGSTYSATAPNGIVASEANGTYVWSVEPAARSVPTPENGTLNVAGAAVLLSVTFAHGSYSVLFTESGLPSGTTWSVTFNGSAAHTSASSLTFGPMTAGQYPFRVPAISGWHPSPSSGNESVFSNVSVTVGWSANASTFAATFHESGLPNGTVWTLQLNHSVGPVHTSTSSLVLHLANGSYGWQANATVNRSAVNASGGTFTVFGAAVAVNVSFYVPAPPLVALSFHESGTPPVGAWTVTLTALSDGLKIASPAEVTRSAPSHDPIVFDVNPGSYSYSASWANGGSVSGSVEVTAQAAQTVSVSGPTGVSGSGPGNSPLGLPGWAPIVGFGLFVIGALGVAGIGLRSRAHRRSVARGHVAQLIERAPEFDRAELEPKE